MSDGQEQFPALSGLTGEGGPVDPAIARISALPVDEQVVELEELHSQLRADLDSVSTG